MLGCMSAVGVMRLITEVLIAGTIDIFTILRFGLATYFKIFDHSLKIQSFVCTVIVAILPYVDVACSLDDLAMVS